MHLLKVAALVAAIVSADAASIHKTTHRARLGHTVSHKHVQHVGAASYEPPAMAVSHDDASKAQKERMMDHLGLLAVAAGLETMGSLVLDSETEGPMDELFYLANNLKNQLETEQSNLAANLAADKADCDTQDLAADIGTLVSDIADHIGDAADFKGAAQGFLNSISGYQSSIDSTLALIPGYESAIATKNTTRNDQIAALEQLVADATEAQNLIRALRIQLLNSSLDYNYNRLSLVETASQVHQDFAGFLEQGTRQLKSRKVKSMMRELGSSLHVLKLKHKSKASQAPGTSLIMKLLTMMQDRLAETISSEIASDEAKASEFLVDIQGLWDTLDSARISIAANQASISDAKVSAAGKFKDMTDELESAAAKNKTLHFKVEAKRAKDIICANLQRKYDAAVVLLPAQLDALEQLMSKLGELGAHLNSTELMTALNDLTVLHFTSVYVNFGSAENAAAGQAQFIGAAEGLGADRVEKTWDGGNGEVVFVLYQAVGDQRTAEEFAEALGDLGLPNIVKHVQPRYLDVCAVSDHAASTCPENAFCISFSSTAECKCKYGYSNANGNCEDVNECQGENECNEGAACHNTEGDYCCEGYSGGSCVNEVADLPQCQEGGASGYKSIVSEDRLVTAHYNDYPTDAYADNMCFRGQGYDPEGQGRIWDDKHQWFRFIGNFQAKVGWQLGGSWGPCATHMYGYLVQPEDDIYLSQGLTSHTTIRYNQANNYDKAFQVTNCGPFYVYKIPNSGICSARLCTEEMAANVASKIAPS